MDFFLIGVGAFFYLFMGFMPGFVDQATDKRHLNNKERVAFRVFWLPVILLMALIGLGTLCKKVLEEREYD